MQSAILKAFTLNGAGGNGAGVVIVDSALTSQCMQAMASDIGLSETVFVLKTGDFSYDVRFFTPVCEVDLCGHATIAAFYYLGEIGAITGTDGPVRARQKTKAGELDIDVYFKDSKVEYVLMQQASPRIYRELTASEKADVAKSLSIDAAEIALEGHDIEPTIVSTGLKDILIPVKSRSILDFIEPLNDQISDISQSCDVVGYHVYTIECGQVHARNFAPLVGIPEECATGTSNGALGGLLGLRGIVKGYMEVVQGEAMKEPSLICVSIGEGAKDIRVGGKATVIKKINKFQKEFGG